MDLAEQPHNNASNPTDTKSNLKFIYILSITTVGLLAALVYLISSQPIGSSETVESKNQEDVVQNLPNTHDSQHSLLIQSIVQEKINEEQARGVVTENFGLYEIFYVKDNQTQDERIAEYKTYIAGLASDSMVGSSYYDAYKNIYGYYDNEHSFTDLTVTRRVTQRIDSSCLLTISYPSAWQDLAGFNAKWRIESKHLQAELFDNTPGCFDVLTIEIPIFVYLVPVSAKQMPNVFSYKDLEIGRQIGDMKILSIEQREAKSYDAFKNTFFRNFSANFNGQTTIVGYLEPEVGHGTYGGNISYEMGITEEKVKSGEIKLTDLSNYTLVVDLDSTRGLPIHDLAFKYIEHSKSEILCISSKEFIQMADLAGVNINDKIRVVVTGYYVGDSMYYKGSGDCLAAITSIESVTRLEE